MFASICVGGLLTAMTIGIHAVGTAWWISILKGVSTNSRKLKKKALPFRLLCTTALVLLSLHLIEVGPWAAMYLWLPQNGSLDTLEEACYFATVTFASLGYGDIVISGPWRLLSAIQAMNGLLVFGWSTALLFAVVERIWGEKNQTPQASETPIPLTVGVTVPQAQFRTSIQPHDLPHKQVA